MPTLEGTTRRLALNQSSRAPLLEDLSGEKLTLFQGLAARIECALFDDTPSSDNFVTTLSNVDKVHLVVRKNSANGGILFSRTVDAAEFEPGTTYAAWIAKTGQQFTFELSNADTTQIVPGSGRLPIYWVVTVELTDGTNYVGGFGFGEIQDVGFVENPLPATYEEGVVPVRGGKLFTSLDANNFPIVNLPLSGVEYVETGSVALTVAQLEVVVEFLFEKNAATYIFTSLYVRDTSVAPQDIRAVVNAQSTTGFTLKLSAAPNTTNCTLVWGVAILDPSRAAQPGTSGPRYAIVPPQGTPARYEIWDVGGSFYNAMAYKTAGVTDAEAIQAAINAAQENSASGAVVLPSGSIWTLDEPLVYDINRPLVFRGEGLANRLVWAHGGNLFEFSAIADGVLFENLVITPAHTGNATHSVFHMPFGALSNTTFRNIVTLGLQNGNRVGNVIDITGGVTDTIYVTNCHFRDIAGVGVKFGNGSSAFIRGLRVLGGTGDSKGIDVLGAFGGLWISDTDLIGTDIGLHLRNAGPGSNREIFLTHGCVDSCRIGLLVDDASYVDWIGTWAASCTHRNIKLGLGDSILQLNGGMVFNAGAGAVPPPSVAHGIEMQSGKLTLTGVSVKDNAIAANPNGIGLLVTGGRSVQVNGGEFGSNKRGFDISGLGWSSITGATFGGNTLPNLGTPTIYQNNHFLEGGNAGEIDQSSYVGVIAWNDIVIPILNNTSTVVTFNSERDDTSNIHSITSNTDRFVIPVTGIYRFEAVVQFANHNAGFRAVSLRVNGVAPNNVVAPDTRNSVQSDVTSILLNSELDLVAGDIVRLVVYQNSGVSLNILEFVTVKMRRVK